MKALAFVPARCGSKSIPFKNIKVLHGRPLIYWTLKALNDCQAVEKVVLATDCQEIEQCARTFYLDKLLIYRRKEENAQDTSSTESVMLEYIQVAQLPNDMPFWLVQATSPFTQTQHLDEAWEQLQTEGADSLLTCVRMKRFFWSKEGESLNYNYLSRPRRQDFEGMLMENGAFYMSRVGEIKLHSNRLSGKVSVYEMPEYTALEIDEPADWLMAEALMAKFHPEQRPKPLPIKLFASDVDGVLTDAGMYYTEKGDEIKKFNTHDGMGFNMIQKMGIKIALITSETTEMVARRGVKLKMDYVYQGKAHGGKLEAIKDICQKEGFGLHEVAYIGDDVNCLHALENVGFAFCPADAVELVTRVPGIVKLHAKGGEGAVREIYERFLRG